MSRGISASETACEKVSSEDCDIGNKNERGFRCAVGNGSGEENAEDTKRAHKTDKGDEEEEDPLLLFTVNNKCEKRNIIHRIYLAAAKVEVIIDSNTSICCPYEHGSCEKRYDWEGLQL